MESKIVKKGHTIKSLKLINLKVTQPRSEQLKRYIKSFWTASLSQNDPSGTSFTLLNDGCAGIIFNLGSTIYFSYGEKEIHVKKNLVISEPSTMPVKFHFQEGANTIGMRFQPYVGRMLVDTSAAGQIARRTPLLSKERIAKHYQELRNLAAKNYGGDQLVSYLESQLGRDFSCPPASELELLKSVMALMNSSPGIPIAKVSEELDLSKKKIQRLFSKYAGMSYKAYTKIGRVRKMKEEIAKGDFSTLTELSLSLNYFDQAHSIKEFRNLMQETPSSYFRKKCGNR